MNIKPFFLLMATTALSAASFAYQTQFAPDELLIKVRPGTVAGLMDSSIGATQIRSIPEIGWRTVKLPAGMTIDQGIAYYKSLKSVETVERNGKLELASTPNDPSYSKQYAPQIMNAPAAWDLSTGASSTIIAIIDTGIDKTHPEFQNGKLLPGYDFSNDDNDPTDDGGDIHGDHCAGIAAASTNNGIGIAGIGYNCRILPVKVFPNSFDDVVSKAIIYAVDKGAKVLSLSLGRGGTSTVLEDAVNYAFNKNTTLFAAAGNSNLDSATSPFYPASYKNAVSVGSTDRGDAKSGFSNYGKLVRIAAPGSDIYSTVPVASGSYAVLSGTSMACPATAGAAGILWSYAAPGTKNTTILNAMFSTAKNVGTWLNGGRVDLAKAIQKIRPLLPLRATLTAGGAYPGTLAAIPAVSEQDGAVFKVDGTFTQGLGQAAAVQTVFALPKSQSVANAVSAKVRIVASVNQSGATHQLYVYDFKAKKYDVIQVPFGPGAWETDIAFDPAKNVDAKGNVQILARALLPQRSGNPTSGLVYSVDQIALTVSFRQ
jgi:thermitase